MQQNNIYSYTTRQRYDCSQCLSISLVKYSVNYLRSLPQYFVSVFCVSYVCRCADTP